MNTKRIPRPFRARLKRAMRKYIHARKTEMTRRGAMSSDTAKATLKRLWRAIEELTTP
jgi:hypothetical protein